MITAYQRDEYRIVKENSKPVIIAILVIGALVTLIMVWNSVDSNGKYNDAMALMDAGNLDEAYSIFQELGNYKDAENKMRNIQLTKTKEQLKTVKVGDYIKFGEYEQDNNESNGKEAVEWLVLEVKDDKALVISKYALDCKQYDTVYDDVTWETSSLRRWLNNDFINSVFSDEEKKMIPTMFISSVKNSIYGTASGKATYDQVFLLSIPEAERYFSSSSARQCMPTDYAVANRQRPHNPGINCDWWLRSPGRDQKFAAFVTTAGGVNELGYYVDSPSFIVRPTLWIDLNS